MTDFEWFKAGWNARMTGHYVTVTFPILRYSKRQAYRFGILLANSALKAGYKKA